MQDYSNSIANALELLQSYTKPSTYLEHILWNCPQVNATRSYWWLVNIVSDNGRCCSATTLLGIQQSQWSVWWLQFQTYFLYISWTFDNDFNILTLTIMHYRKRDILQPLLGPLSWCLIIKFNHCNSSEYWAPHTFHLAAWAPFQYPVRRLVVRSREISSHEICTENCLILLKFDRCIGSIAVDVSVKFQSDVII